MPALSTDAFLETLAQTQLLGGNQLAEIRGWASGKAAEPNAVAAELARRGWLTQYQAREAVKGRASELYVGPYLLLDILGEGGMGRVFRARHTRLGRDVALKVIRKEKLSNPQTVNRFTQEIHAAAQLSHPNVVLAFDAESAGGNLFLSMEYVEGTDLTKLVRQNGPMPIAHACDAIRQAALGLQHAHERGLVHRDIKPSNLLYTPKGQVKVLDLGLAQLGQSAAGGENAGRVTQEGFVLGTPDFLAPEQAQNSGGVDARADVYSLGATLFYLLTARVPFEAPTSTDKLIKHITEPPPSLVSIRPEIPPQLNALVHWLMAKRPEDRPQSAAQVAMALLPFALPQSGAVAPQPPPAPAMPVAAPVATAFATDSGETFQAPPRVRVREPNGASSLPLLLIAGGVLLAVCGGVMIGLYYMLFGGGAGDGGPLDPEFTNTAGQKMLKIEPGTFRMGSPDDETGREKGESPRHQVTLSSAFYMSATEVTRGQFTAVTSKSPGPPPLLSDQFLDRVPATHVTWEAANEFCRRLNEKEPTRRGGWEYRLPTEAEWEYAARAGTDGPFPTGKKAVQFTNGIFQLAAADEYGEPHPKLDGPYPFDNRPAPTGAKASDKDFKYAREPNPWGLLDMSGNVWEWCRDVYDDYPADDATDPTGPAKGAWRVLRGGAFDTPAGRCRSAAREGMDPDKKMPNVGFRVVFAPKK